jgi:hypothetical protein
MHNPLIKNLSELSINELEDKIIDLQRKYFLTHNPSVQAQISNFLEIYRDEARTRRALEAQKQKQMQGDDDNSLDNLINIS